MANTKIFHGDIEVKDIIDLVSTGGQVRLNFKDDSGNTGGWLSMGSFANELYLYSDKTDSSVANLKIDTFLNGGTASSIDKIISVTNDTMGILDIHGDGTILIDELGEFQTGKILLGLSHANSDITGHGIEIKHQATENEFFIVKSASLSHDVTSELPADAFFKLEKVSDISSGDGGGVRFTSINTNGSADEVFSFRAISETGIPSVSYKLQSFQRDGTGGTESVPDDNTIFLLENNTSDKLKVYGDGTTLIGNTTDLGRLGIGFNSLASLDVENGGIELYQAASDNVFFIAKSVNASHDFTSELPASSYFQVSKMSDIDALGRGGGVSFVSVNRSWAGNSQSPFQFKAVSENSIPTIGFRFQHVKLDGAGGIEDISASERVAIFSSSDDTLAKLTIYGDATVSIGNSTDLGRMSTGTTNYVDIDVEAGGIELNQEATDNVFFIAKSKSLTNPVTAVMSSSSYFQARKLVDAGVNAGGGLGLDIFTNEDNVALELRNIMPNGASLFNSTGLKIVVAESDGAGDVQSTNANPLEIYNDTNLLFRMITSGLIYFSNDNTTALSGTYGTIGYDNYANGGLELGGVGSALHNYGIHLLGVIESDSSTKPGAFVYIDGRVGASGTNGIVGFGTHTLFRNYISNTMTEVAGVAGDGSFAILNDGIFASGVSTIQSSGKPNNITQGGISLNNKTNSYNEFVINLEDTTNITGTYAITNYANASSYFTLTKHYAGSGGVRMNAVAKYNATGLANAFTLNAIAGDENTTDASNTQSYAPIQLNVMTRDNAGSAGSLADRTSMLGNTANALIIRNGSIEETTLGTGKREIFKIKGSGRVIVDTYSATGESFEIRASGTVAHGITNFSDTATYFMIAPSGTTSGGAMLSGLSESAVGFSIRGFATAPSTTTTGGVVSVSGYKKNGAGTTSVANDENLFTVANGSGMRFIIKGSGSLITMGAGNSPVSDTATANGGLHLHGDNASNPSTPYLVISDERVSHGFTSTISSTDAFFFISKIDNDAGGAEIVGLLDDDGVDADADTTALRLVGKAQAGTINTDTNTTARGVIEMRMNNSSSTGSVGNTENMLVIRNNTSARLILKGNGDLHIDGTSNVYDDYDDIKLTETARYMLAGWDNKVIKENKEQLESLGIMENGFINVQKMQALHLGTQGQLWNMIRHLGKKLGLTETALLEIAKDYS